MVRTINEEITLYYCAVLKGDGSGDAIIFRGKVNGWTAPFYDPALF